MLNQLRAALFTLVRNYRTWVALALVALDRAHIAWNVTQGVTYGLQDSLFRDAALVAIVLFMLYYSVGGIQGLRLMVTYPSAFSGYTYLSFATAIMSVLCMLMLVLNGYVWLALQSYQKLTPHQEHFYRELMTQLGKEPVEKPRMFELAQAISEGCKKLKDKSFLEKI